MVEFSLPWCRMTTTQKAKNNEGDKSHKDLGPALDVEYVRERDFIPALGLMSQSVWFAKTVVGIWRVK